MSERITAGTIITDCHDANAESRQRTNFNRLFGVQPSFVGVEGDGANAAAAGNLIDQLDVLSYTSARASSLGERAVILMNVARRGDHTNDPNWNGTPFGYFEHEGTVVGSTYGPELSLARDFGITDSIQLFDIPAVVAAAVEWGELSPEEAERIKLTQFRSLDFLPRAVRWLLDGRPVPSERTSLDNVGSLSNQVWATDNFGNAKTTLTARDIDYKEGGLVTLASGETVSCIEHLARVPRGDSALTKGSSGLGEDRFLELVVQRGSAARRHGLEVGSPILLAEH